MSESKKRLEEENARLRAALLLHGEFLEAVRKAHQLVYYGSPERVEEGKELLHAALDAVTPKPEPEPEPSKQARFSRISAEFERSRVRGRVAALLAGAMAIHVGPMPSFDRVVRAPRARPALTRSNYPRG